ncbi:MAG: UPF0179 family protein [Candidatus Nezhaarchaeales archaeon]
MRIIALIGKAQARKGFRFVYSGISRQCLSCKLRPVCVDKLEVGRVYEVVAVRERVHPCELHEGGVRVVELEEAPVLAAIPSKLACEGAIVTFNPITCQNTKCAAYQYCCTQALRAGDKCFVEKVHEKLECRKGLSLRLSSLRRL